MVPLDQKGLFDQETLLDPSPAVTVDQGDTTITGIISSLIILTAILHLLTVVMVFHELFLYFSTYFTNGS